MTNDVQRLLIQSLSAIVEEKRQRFQMLGLMNTASDPAERAKQSMEYAQAQADLINAETALRSAITRKSASS